MKVCQIEGCSNLTNGKLCKPCDIARRASSSNPNYKRFWHTSKKYGVDESGFDVLWFAFNGKCGICEKELKQPTKTRGQSLDVVAIDHDHDTGNVRGLLCNACNKAIGLLSDDINILKRAIQYLEMCNEKVGNDSQN
jgi:hypothetical protein